MRSSRYRFLNLRLEINILESGNNNPVPFRVMVSRIALFESLTPMIPWEVLFRYFTSPSGPIHPRASAAHGETYSTSVFGVSPESLPRKKPGTSIQIAATTTKICASWTAPLVLAHSVSPARFFATTTPTYSMLHSRRITEPTEYRETNRSIGPESVSVA